MRNTKIANFYIFIFSNENVGWLDIPVNDTLPVRIIQGIGTFKNYLYNLIDRQQDIRPGVTF